MQMIQCLHDAVNRVPVGPGCNSINTKKASSNEGKGYKQAVLLMVAV